MTVDTVMTRLYQMQLQCPADATATPKFLFAYNDAPRTLDAGNMPCFVNLPGQATNDYANLGDNQYINSRLYYMRLYILPWVLGIEGESSAQLRTIIPLVYAFFAARPKLGGIVDALGNKIPPLANVRDAFITSDTGLVPFKFEENNTILGCEFRLQVNEYQYFDYAYDE